MKYYQNTKLQTWTHTIKQTLSFVVACVCVVVLGGMMTVGVLKLQPFSVASNSMEPNLSVGELVFVKATTNYSAGDILSFKSKEHGGIVITHRCIDVEIVDGTTHYLCAGDNNSVALSVQDVVAEDVVGKVVYSSMLLGQVVNFLQTNRIFILAVGAMVAIIYIIYNKDIYKGKIHT